MNVYTREPEPEPNELCVKCDKVKHNNVESKMLQRRGYFVTGLLGEGTYSKVKQARSTTLECDVAIKIISRDDAPEAFRERFLPREIEILSQVSHPKVVHVFEIFESKSPRRVYIVTELLRSGDLLEKIKANGVLPERSARYVASDICRAVAYLHNKNIAHRDVKCENILLDKRELTSGQKGRNYPCFYSAKLCDFGFARKFPTSREICQSSGRFVTDTFCGSAAYASPEILERKSHDAMAADVWALGIVFFIVLHGSMPFDDADIMAMVEEQKGGKVLENQHVKISKAAKHFLASALIPDPTKRCTVFDLLRHPWLRYCSGTPVHAGSSTTSMK